jgi:hypothetical protein
VWLISFGLATVPLHVAQDLGSLARFTLGQQSGGGGLVYKEELSTAHNGREQNVLGIPETRTERVQCKRIEL